MDEAQLSRRNRYTILLLWVAVLVTEAFFLGFVVGIKS